MRVAAIAPGSGGRALLLGLAVAAACAAREPIKVGLVSGLTGRHSDLGISSRNGATLALAEINAAGGVGGRRVELIVRDDGQDPEQARRAVGELIAAGAVAIIGHATSSMAAATLSMVDREQVLMVSPTVTSPDFSGRDDWFVRLMVPNDVTARTMAGVAVDRLGARRVAVIYDTTNAAYSRTFATAFRAALEQRGGAARELPYASGQATAFGALADQALQGGTQAVLVVADALDTAALLQQVRKRSATVGLLGSDWGFTQDLLAQGGSAADGAIFPQSVNLLDPSPAFRRFLENYQARFHRPADFAAIVSYEAMQLLAEALRREPSRAGVRRAVLGLERFQGLQGEILIDRFGDVSRRVFLFTVRGGRTVPLE